MDEKTRYLITLNGDKSYREAEVAAVKLFKLLTECRAGRGVRQPP
jgi:hypothetical protein